MKNKIKKVTKKWVNNNFGEYHKMSNMEKGRVGVFIINGQVVAYDTYFPTSAWHKVDKESDLDLVKTICNNDDTYKRDFIDILYREINDFIDELNNAN